MVKNYKKKKIPFRHHLDDCLILVLLVVLWSNIQIIETEKYQFKTHFTIRFVRLIRLLRFSRSIFSFSDSLIDERILKGESLSEVLNDEELSFALAKCEDCLKDVLLDSFPVSI